MEQMFVAIFCSPSSTTAHLATLESMDLNLTAGGCWHYVTNEVHLQHLDTLRASSGWNSTFRLLCTPMRQRWQSIWGISA